MSHSDNLSCLPSKVSAETGHLTCLISFNHLAPKATYELCHEKTSFLYMQISCTADHHDYFYFRYNLSTSKIDPSTSKSPNFKPLVICGCTARFVSELVQNAKDRFSHDAACIKGTAKALILSLIGVFTASTESTGHMSSYVT